MSYSAALGARFLKPLFVAASSLRSRSPAAFVVALIAGSFIFRTVLALTVGLGVDESYSLANAHDLALSYFDHPPLHLWLAHFAGEMFGYGRLARLPFLLMFAGTTWMMFRFTERLFGAGAGAWAALALNLAGFFTVAAGEWILPDGPLMFCLAGAAASFAAVLKSERSPNSGMRWHWLALGLWLGGAGLSKYQAAAFAVGLALFLATTPRHVRLLTYPAPYVAAFLALAIVAPVFVWNAEHGWISLAFQAGRGAQGRDWKPIHVLTIIGGQILYLLPWIFVPLAWALASAVRTGRSNEARWLCLCLGLPLIVLITVIPLFGPAGLPHWSMAGWLMIFPLLGERLAQTAEHRAWPWRWAQVSAALLIGACTLLATHAATGWVRAVTPDLFKTGDPSIETLEWNALRSALQQQGLLQKASFVVALRWNQAGKIELALDQALPVIVMTQDPRNFAFRNDPAAFVGRDAIIVGIATTVQENINGLRAYFAELTPLPAVVIERDGRPEITLSLVYARDLLKPYPLPYR